MRSGAYSGAVRFLGGILAVVLLAACSGGGKDKPDVVIGSTPSSVTTALPAATIPAPPPPPEPPPPPPPPPQAARGGGLKPADGRPYPAAIAFRSGVPVPSELVFVLVIGSDARPGQDIRRTNGDSIHLVAVNGRTREGTIVGFPRDSWVEIPGRGRGKLNSALPKGGPGLMAETVRRLTGLPVHYYVLTGFQGLAALVDELGGVHVHVDRRMNDRLSGARFEPGWHNFNGGQVLAFSRNRYDVPNGDFSRSFNQGTVMLAALAKMRAEVGDDGGLRRWVSVLSRHAALDVAPDRLLGLAALGRNLDPGRLRNIVVPGRIGSAGRQSVVFLTEEAGRIFLDLRPDGVIGGASAAPQPPPTTAAPTTTTTAPAPIVPPQPAPTSTTSTTLRLLF